MKAFEVLDQENKGYLTTEELTKYMSEEGHNFICCSPHYPSFSQGSAVADLVVSMVNALNFLFLFFILFTTFFLSLYGCISQRHAVSKCSFTALIKRLGLNIHILISLLLLLVHALLLL